MRHVIEALDDLRAVDAQHVQVVVVSGVGRRQAVARPAAEVVPEPADAPSSAA